MQHAEIEAVNHLFTWSSLILGLLILGTSPFFMKKNKSNLYFWLWLILVLSTTIGNFTQVVK